MDSMVQDTQHLVTKWKHEVSDQQTRYSWLLYFSVPKILLLYQLIHTLKEKEIVREVSFLAINQPEEREKLKNRVLVSENV